jgi:F0F1-type ATP synthase assembly protein I
MEDGMADDPNAIPPADPDRGRNLRDYVKAESMLQLALAIPAGCFIGWAIGASLDRHFHTAWIAVAGIVLGAIAGFVQIFTTASRYLKNGR